MNRLSELTRLVRRRPGLSLLAVFLLSLGIGANSAIFSAVHAILLTPLPFEEPERLVAMWKAQPQLDAKLVEVSYPEFREWQRQSRSFAGVAAIGASPAQLALTGRERPEGLTGVLVSGELFTVLGAKAAEGRLLVAEDDIPGTERRLVLSDGLRRRLFGPPGPGGQEAVGQRLLLSGQTFTVVGVVPPRFDYPAGAEFWVPVTALFPDAVENKRAGFLLVIARLADGIGPDQARDEMNRVVPRVATDFGIGSPAPVVSMTPLSEHLTGDTRGGLWILFGLVTLILLIACADVASLLLSQAAGRRTELAVRSSVGADRGRLVRQLVLESVPLAVLGGVGGLALAGLGIRLLQALGPTEIPRLADVRLSAPVVGFTALLSLVALLASAILPAWRMAQRMDLREVLVESGGGSLHGRQNRRWMSLLVGVQAAMAVLLLIAAGLLVSRFRSLQEVELGFRPEGILTAQILFAEGTFPEPPKMHVFYGSLLERLRALPGVTSAGAVLLRPLESEIGWDTSFTAEGQTHEEHLNNPKANLEIISPGYFRSMGIPIVAGRDFTAQDRDGAAPVAILSEGLARRLWPDAKAGEVVGKRIKNFGPDHANPWKTIVGVVGDVHYRTLAAPTLDYYLPYSQDWLPPAFVVVRTANDPLTLASALEREVWALDRNLPVTRITTMEAKVASVLAEPRFLASLSGLFAVIATLLAALGIYGVVAYSVFQRTREIGLRTALGASRTHVLRLVAREGLLPAAAGAGLGLLAAYWLHQALTRWLTGPAAADPTVFTAAVLFLVIAASLAVYLPSRRALKVDPSLALREE